MSAIPGENSGSAYTSAKHLPVGFLPADRTAKSLDDRLRVFLQEQSCIDKLVLACFWLNLPLGKTLSAIALLLSNHISSANIAEVAAILDHKLASYRHRLSQNRRHLDTLQGCASDIKLWKVYPETLLELDKGLDDLLILLRCMDAASSTQLRLAGRVNQHSLRSKGNVKGKIQVRDAR